MLKGLRIVNEIALTNLQTSFRIIPIQIGGYSVLQDRTGYETPNPGRESLNLREVRAEAETQAIYRALERANKNISQASRMLGVSRPTLYNLIAKYGIVVD